MFDNFADSALYLLSSKFALPFSSISPVKGVMKGTLTITNYFEISFEELTLSNPCF